jgi:hypothetical protein
MALAVLLTVRYLSSLNPARGAGLMEAPRHWRKMGQGPE